MRYKSNNHSHKLMIISLVVIFLIISLNALNLSNNILYKAKKYRNSENITILNTLALSSDKISVGGAIKSGVTIADLNKDGKNELIFASSNGILYAYNETNQLWNFTTSNLIWTSPIVVDIDNDGENEVLFGGFDQKFYCLHVNGTLKWSYSDFYLNPINVNFVVGDINGDGKNEIIFAKFSRLYALNGTGQLIWTRQFSIYKIDGITLADITNDKIPEILFNLSNNTLIALNGNGSIYKSIKINLSLPAAPLILENMIITQNSSDIIALDYGFNLLWNTELNLTITSPVAADLNHDSYYEIVVNSISDNETVV
ncbi:MAG: FG-GAP-like repeat-containing protein, partial [Promethearchaeota archaeon]